MQKIIENFNTKIQVLQYLRFLLSIITFTGIPILLNLSLHYSKYQIIANNFILQIL